MVAKIVDCAAKAGDSTCAYAAHNTSKRNPFVYWSINGKFFVVGLPGYGEWPQEKGAEVKEAKTSGFVTV